MRITIGVAAAATAVFAAWMGFDFGGPVATRWVSDFVLVVVAAVSAAYLFGAARQAGGSTSRGWWWLGVSSAAWALGQLVWALQQNVFDHNLPVGSFPDLFWIVGSVGGIYAVARLASGSPLSKVRVGLDGAIAALALLAVSWTVVVDPALESGILGSVGAITASSYKVMDVVELALLLSVVAASARRGRSPVMWLCAAGALHAAVNATYTALVAKGAYQTGDLLDTGWFAAFAALIIAGRAAQVEPMAWQSYILPQPRALLPYIPVVVGAVAILWTSHGGSDLDIEVLQVAAVIGVLMVPRQWIALQEHAKSYRRLAEAQQIGGVGSWEQDLRSGRVSWSDEMFEIFGLDQREGDPTRESFLEVVHADDRDRVVAAVGRATDEGRTFSLDHRLVLPDGSTRWVRAIGRSTGGRRPRLMGTVQDVTESKAAELAARQSQKLEALGRLAGGVAHDFNNLLTPIIAHGELLNASMEPNDSRMRSVAAISSAGHRAMGLTQQLLAFCRTQESMRVPVDINRVVDEVAALVASSLPSDVIMTVQKSDRAAVVEADAGQLHQVVLNLALNAIDAMPGGGTVFVTTEVGVPVDTQVVVGSVPYGECVRLTVADTGSGMDTATLARCFEPFFTTKFDGRGTGLGLPMVYGIVTQSGGGIAVETEPGCGTAVSVLLAHVAVAPAGPTPKPDTSPNGVATIIVVDDDDAVLDVVSQILKAAGYGVIGFVDGREALEALSDLGQVDLLVTDVVMPHLGGVELAAGMHELRPDLPVLYTSGYNDGGEALRAADASGQILAKPFFPADLREAVSLALAGAPSK